MELTLIVPTITPERADMLAKDMCARAWHPKTSSILSVGCYSVVESMKCGADGEVGDVLVFLHDDAELLEDGWDERILDFFEKMPRCGMLGPGGALGLGTDELYKARYDYRQLARINYVSNMVNAEAHGARETRPRQVSVLDGFCQAIRRTAYDSVDGWSAVLKLGINFHMYDAAMACLMAEKGWEVWMLPLKCKHHGGLTSTAKEYNEWLAERMRTDKEVHEQAHRVCYERFRNVLPLRVKE